MYGNKQSDGLKAPARQYEYVVFNVTTSDKSEVSKWISDNAVNALVFIIGPYTKAANAAASV